MRYNIFKSRDKNYIENLFEKKKQKFFPEFKNSKITNIAIKEISPSWAKDTCLNKYKVSSSNRKRKEIRETSSAKNSKKEVWKIMNRIYNVSFGGKEKSIPRPICFVPRYNLLFYDEAPGIPLSALMAKKDLQATRESLISAGRWLAELHQLKVNKNIKKAFYPKVKGYKSLFKKIKKYLPEIKKDLEGIKNIEFIDKSWEREKVLIHADFYPGNIIVNRTKLFVIDFDKSGVGPFLMDIATLYGSLEFPKTIWNLQFSQKEKKDLQEVFLGSYCQARNIDFLKTKLELKKFLTKIFLDQLRYHFLFNLKNIDSMKKKNRADLIKKLRDLIAKIK